MERSKKTNDRLTYTLIHAFKLEECGDIEGAIDEFKSASRRGSLDAKSKLGTIYDDVVNPPQPERAVIWYKRGVAAGDPSCAWNLAMHYAGIGNKRWYSYWLCIAAKMGDPDAKEEIDSKEWWNKRNKNN